MSRRTASIFGYGFGAISPKAESCRPRNLLRRHWLTTARLLNEHGASVRPRPPASRPELGMDWVTAATAPASRRLRSGACGDSPPALAATGKPNHFACLPGCRTAAPHPSVLGLLRPAPELGTDWATATTAPPEGVRGQELAAIRRPLIWQRGNRLHASTVNRMTSAGSWRDESAPTPTNRREANRLQIRKWMALVGMVFALGGRALAQEPPALSKPHAYYGIATDGPAAPTQIRVVMDAEMAVPDGRQRLARGLHGGEHHHLGGRVDGRHEVHGGGRRHERERRARVGAGRRRRDHAAWPECPWAAGARSGKLPSRSRVAR